VKELGFSSHRTQGLLVKYSKQDKRSIGVEFLKMMQPVIAAADDLGNVVAMDQKRFTKCGLIISGYGPIGGYAFVVLATKCFFLDFLHFEM
jgi:hypothetical protein